MPEPRVAPYGSWRSPITSDLIVAGTVGLSQVMLDGPDVYWVEARPTEGGRNVVVRRGADGVVADVVPAPFNARTQAHEYGGGAYAVADGVVYFSNFADQRVYQLNARVPGSVPEPLTPDGADLRYADAIVDRARNRLICVREDHRDGDREAVNTIAAVSLVGGDEGTVLVSGHDFFSSPRLSPDGRSLAWLAWSHPNMPWDGTELWVGEVTDGGQVGNAQLVAGGATESIFQPEWSPDGVLHFISDRTGWWNLYRWDQGQVQALAEVEADFGVPQWVFGLSTYAFESASRIICTFLYEGRSELALLERSTGRLDPIPTRFTSISYVRAQPGRVTLVAGAPAEPTAVVRLGLGTRTIEVLRRSSDLQIDPAYLSIPQEIEFPTEGGLKAHAFLYLPRNPDARAPEGERPPLLVIIHGGPTSATSTALSLGIQYWTTRGFVVLDVNYGGSTGYGREYRQRLNGQWGVVDVDDCVNGAQHLMERGQVDGGRLAIRGGSAGGYTTLAALTFRDVFNVGASYYGVSDAEALATDTHKFESRYLDSLIGPYPETRDLYLERSPIRFAESLSTPVIFFQGLEDKIVPPDQAERMVEVLKHKGVPVAYVPFEGEQHGFRRAENIKRALDAELYFYSRILGFELAEPVEPVTIENL